MRKSIKLERVRGLSGAYDVIETRNLPDWDVDESIGKDGVKRLMDDGVEVIVVSSVPKHVIVEFDEDSTLNACVRIHESNSYRKMLGGS